LIGTLGLCGLILVGCADTGEPEASNRPVYVVRAHDTLYSIAWRYHLDYRDLAKWNNIGAGFRIAVGQTLRLAPPRSAQSGSSTSRGTPRAGQGAPSGAATGAGTGIVGGTGTGTGTGTATGAGTDSGTGSGSNSNSAAPGTSVNSASLGSGSAGRAATAAPRSAPPSALKWVWPTERLSAPRTVPGGGILLSGRVGQDIRAACAGRVVYAGNGLRGYGNLIIIKHAENLLSAYAHNRELLVRDGDEVALGQVIGHMGEGAPQTPVLYFEIRRNGKPVDPVPFLPVAK
jgi:lipoprotein NlpD